jgi:hypothetical protein
MMHELVYSGAEVYVAFTAYFPNRMGVPSSQKKKMSHMSHVSIYDIFILPDVPIDSISNKKLWKLKILLWINIFGWYLRKGVILTKDNLVKQN